MPDERQWPELSFDQWRDTAHRLGQCALRAFTDRTSGWRDPPRLEVIPSCNRLGTSDLMRLQATGTDFRPAAERAMNLVGVVHSTRRSVMPERLLLQVQEVGIEHSSSCERAIGERGRGRDEARGSRRSGERRRPGEGLLYEARMARGCRLHQRRRLATRPADAPRVGLLVLHRQGNHECRARIGSRYGRGRRRHRRGASNGEGGRRQRDGSVPFRNDLIQFRDERGRAPGRDPKDRSYFSIATFTDPDGNTWAIQEIKTRFPGRGLSSIDVASLVPLLREAEERHARYESDSPKHHWSTWYAPYLVARARGMTSDEAARQAALAAQSR